MGTSFVAETFCQLAVTNANTLLHFALKRNRKMKETPNKDNPQADVVAVVEELLDLFNEAKEGGAIELQSRVGSTFHARVLNAARHLGLTVL